MHDHAACADNIGGRQRPQGRVAGPGASPDRADAMVWALTALQLSDRPEPRITFLDI
jgi:phage terminase large subunit-like protein